MSWLRTKKDCVQSKYLGRCFSLSSKENLSQSRFLRCFCPRSPCFMIPKRIHFLMQRVLALRKLSWYSVWLISSICSITSRWKCIKCVTRTTPTRSHTLWTVGATGLSTRKVSGLSTRPSWNRTKNFIFRNCWRWFQTRYQNVSAVSKSVSGC